MSFGTSFEGALNGCNWTILLHTIFGKRAQNSAMSMAESWNRFSSLCERYVNRRSGQDCGV